ncbi:MAG: hypothetical protein KY466_04225 [Gemmatimonadetes bacterium]|nr:hypothetical protein [Gemmatimonadota bacterium]
MRTRLTLLLLAPLAACSDGGADMDFGGEDLGEDRFAIRSDDGAVRMGLTDDVVYFALSDSVRAVARAEMEDDTPREGIAGSIAGAVRGGVSRALAFRAKYPVAEIRDIRWEDGRMTFDFEDPDRTLSREFEVDDRPIAEAFSEQDVLAFAREFRRLKRQRGEREG